jgi:Zn-dependent protease
MIVIPGRIPIMIHPLFWLTAALIGWINSASLIGIAVWVGIVFVSVLFHEYGHALTAVLFKQKAHIQLVVLGGLTSYEGPRLSFWQQFLIVFNGPLFGFLLFLGASFALSAYEWTPLAYQVLYGLKWINLLWTVINLLPVMPLDGGQLLRIALEGFFGMKGFRASLAIGALLALLIALYFFLIQAFLAGAFFFLFAFQSFDAWRKSRKAVRADRDDALRAELGKAEAALQEGRVDEGRRLFEHIASQARGGVLAAVANQYLAFLDLKEGKRDEAYRRLEPIAEELEGDLVPLLHELAFEHQNYALVTKLATPAYQTAPTQLSALRTARAFAHLKEGKAAGGWLQTAWQHHPFPLAPLLEEPPFSYVCEDPDFRSFINPLLKGDTEISG